MFDEIDKAKKIRNDYLGWFPDYELADKLYDVNDNRIQKDLTDYKAKYHTAIQAMLNLEMAYVELDSLYDAWTERNEY